ncbi:MAG: PIN domain-containing protein [Caldilineaceae bacterium]
MKILFDNNIILDVLLNREPFVNDVQQLFVRVETGTVDGVIGATSLTDLYCVLSKLKGRESAKEIIRRLLLHFNVLNVTESAVNLALESQISDFEDAILDCAAWYSDVDVIVTRNEKDFANGLTPVYGPQTLLAILASN